MHLLKHVKPLAGVRRTPYSIQCLQTTRRVKVRGGGTCLSPSALGRWRHTVGSLAGQPQLLSELQTKEKSCFKIRLLVVVGKHTWGWPLTSMPMHTCSQQKVKEQNQPGVILLNCVTFLHKKKKTLFLLCQKSTWTTKRERIRQMAC